MKYFERWVTPGSWYARWFALFELIKPWYRRFPELLTVGFVVANPAVLGPASDGGSARKGVLRKMLSFVWHARAPRLILEEVPVVLVYHHNQTNSRDPMLRVAENLRKQGVSSLTLGPDDLRLWECGRAGGDGAEGEDDLAAWWYDLKGHAFSRWYAVGLMLRSGVVTLLLIGLVLHHRRVELKDLYRHPLRLWWRMLRTSHLIRAADHLLSEVGAEVLVVTIERLPPCSSFLAGKRAQTIAKLHYHHGFATRLEVPYLSDEVLVWNERDEWMVRQMVAHDYEPHLSVVGNAELDRVISPSHGSDRDERLGVALDLPEHDRPVFLLISEYVQGVPSFVRASEIVLEWLEDVVEECPDWIFAIKERNQHDGIRVALERRGLLTRANIQLVSHEVATVAELLAANGVKAVAALSSTALYLAAGAGVVAARLAVRDHDDPIPFLDDFVVKLRSPAEWSELLREVQGGSCRRDAGGVDAASVARSFPYRGTCVERITGRIVEHLENGRSGT